MKKILLNHELLLGLVVVAAALAIGAQNPAFFTLGNVYDLLKSSVVPGIFALGVLIVLVSGGIDISFTAIAAFSMYVTSTILLGRAVSAPTAAAFLLAGTIGCLLGMVNAVFISFFRLPTLIVTLGTASLFTGCLRAFIGTKVIYDLPPGLVRFSKALLFERTLPRGETIGLSPSVFLFLGAALVTWFLLRYTMVGRGIYAMGGNPEAAARAGFSLTRLRFLIYGSVGFLSGIVGIVHTAMMRKADPFDLVGMELVVIAAVVLGGAGIFGGRGTVLGTVLGVLLIVMINNSLILVGIPSYCQKAIVGVIILASTGLSAQGQRLTQRGGALC